MDGAGADGRVELATADDVETLDAATAEDDGGVDRGTVAAADEEGWTSRGSNDLEGSASTDDRSSADVDGRDGTGKEEGGDFTWRSLCAFIID